MFFLIKKLIDKQDTFNEKTGKSILGQKTKHQNKDGRFLAKRAYLCHERLQH